MAKLQPPIDPDQIRVTIQDVEQGYYGEVSFFVKIEAWDQDSQKWITVKMQEESVSGDYCRCEN